MSDQTDKSEYSMYIRVAGGAICCRRCLAQSTRTKLQCARPALKVSRTQKCQFHGGRPHSEETLKRISAANTLHGEATSKAKNQYRHDSAKIRELEDALYVLKMAEGPRIRGRKPLGYRPVRTVADLVEMIRKRFLHIA